MDFLHSYLSALRQFYPSIQDLPNDFQILLLSQSDEERLTCANYLNKLQFGGVLLEADTLAAGLQLSQSAHLDLAIVDLAMPGNEGQRFIQQIAQSPTLPGLSIIALADLDAGRLLADGANPETIAYIEKSSFSPISLYHSLRQVVDASGPAHTYTILVVEDSPEDRYAYKRYLSRSRGYHYQFLEATTIAEGLQLWQQQQPDLLLLDMNLPDGTGLDLLRAVAQSSYRDSLTTLVITGAGNEQVSVKAMKLGAADYLVKSDINESTLNHAVRSTLERAELIGQLIYSSRHQAFTSSIALKVRETLDLSQILDSAVKNIREFLSADRVLICRYRVDGSQAIAAESVSSAFLSCRHQRGFIPACLQVYGVGDLIPGKVMAIDNTQEAGLEGADSKLLDQYQVQGQMVAPIFEQSSDTSVLWGVMLAQQCSGLRRWSTLDVRAMEQLSIQLAITIQQSILYERVKASEAALANSNEALLAAIQAKDEFVATMSHELRTPLNAILGMSQSLQENVFGELGAEQLRAVQIVNRSGEHLLNLINDILDFAKAEAGHIELDLTLASVDNLLDTALTLLRSRAQARQISLTLTPSVCEVSWWLDTRRILQVLSNLVDNAIKFSAEGNDVNIRVLVVTRQPAPSASAEDWLRFEVEDTGIGIGQADLPKLFQPFSQIDSALNRRYMGTGLGLALSKRLVELHGGDIGVDSQIGVGSRFWIELPANPQANSEGVLPSSMTREFDEQK